MPFKAPLNIDHSSHTSGTVPDGRTLPLAWELTTGKVYMKVAMYFPWNRQDGNKAVQKLVDAGGVYLPDVDEWFRGVWVPAPTQIFDADYTRKQQLELSRNGEQRQLLSGNGIQTGQSATGFPLGLTAGGGGMQKVGSTTLEGDYEEVEDPEDEENGEGEGEENGEAEPEEASGRKKKKAKRGR